MSHPRRLTMDLPDGRSAFLWGARQTGKTTWLKQTFPDGFFYDLLDSSVMLRLAGNPRLLGEELAARTNRSVVIIDEVQKLPVLLDEVHRLIESDGYSFILCGSSARKLRRQGVNLLGVRAWRYAMYPLTFSEVTDFDLLTALNNGLLPGVYGQPQYGRSLRAYVEDYLTQEVFNEGLTRNVSAFSRFFDALRFSHGELTNYSAIARDCGVDGKTVREYYQILVDTLLGYFVTPFSKRKGRQSITSTPKFYLFDVGVAGHVCRRSLADLAGSEFGKAFEHFILMELVAYRDYCNRDFEINFWRTKSGLEVDFILAEGETAIEVKGRVRPSDLKSMRAFDDEFQPKHSVLVCNETTPRRLDKIDILPWRDFVSALWSGKIV